MEGPQSAVVVVYATFPEREAALSCGRGMVEAGVAGCINVIGGMTSVYVWQGVTETAEEVVLIAKVARERSQDAVNFIVARHTYETPAILVLPVVGGSEAYMQWIRQAAPPA